MNSLMQSVFLALTILFFCIENAYAISCYKCKGDDECDFNKRQIYIENCTWATKCWGARIGDHFIRGCADDRCDIQIGVGSYIESKCCYTDKCNNEQFFFPNSSSQLTLNYVQLGVLLCFVKFCNYFKLL